MELSAQQVRGVNVGSIVVAALLILLALFVFTGADQAGTRIVFLVVLAVLLVVQVWLLLQARRATAHHAEAAPAEVGPAPEASLEEPAQMVIKCKQCGTVFPVRDTGARPLVAACPSCGKSGTIKVKADVA